MTGTFRALARRGAAWIVRQRTVTTLGIRVPEGDETGQGGRYDVSLYDGAAGVALVLQDLHAAAGGRPFGALARELREGLVESTPFSGPLPPGLFSGYGGVALTHLAHARSKGDVRSLERALEIGRRIAAAPLPGADLIGGAAGVGLIQLALHRATGDAGALAAAGEVVRFLGHTAEWEGETAAWRPHTGESDLQPGLAHGVAGPCLFLVHFAAASGDAEAGRLAEAGFRWLDAHSVPAGGGLSWPHDLASSGTRYHWCHGSVGVGQAYLAWYRLGGPARAGAVAVAAAEATCRWTRARKREPTCHCHGRAGTIEFLLDLHEASLGRGWRRRAEAMAKGLVSASEARTRGGSPRRGASSLGGTGAGLSMGTAGVVRALLRLAGEPVSPILEPGAGPIRLRAARPARTGRPRTEVPRLRGGVGRLLPPVAARFPSGDGFVGRHVVLGPPDAASARRTLRALADAPAGGAFFLAHARAERELARLAARYGALLAPGALGTDSVAPVLREIAGLGLSPRVNAAALHRRALQAVGSAVRALDRMLARLASDVRGALAEDVGGRLKSVELRGGDPHRGGERVVALAFDEGMPLVYKARSVAIDRELAGEPGRGERATLASLCLGWVEPSIPRSRLPTHRVVEAGPWHGYAEVIRTDPAAVPAGVNVERHGFDAWEVPTVRVHQLERGEEARYWYTAGLLAGHAFALGISDLHIENVVCGTSRSAPLPSLHAIDLEIAFVRVEHLRDTGLAPLRSPHGLHSHAGLYPPVHLDCGVSAEEWALALTEGGVRPMPRPRETVAWTYPHAARNPDGSYGPGPHLPALLRGMADQWWALRAHRRTVREHLRGALSGKPARILAKPTQSYHLAIERRKTGATVEWGAVSGSEWPLGLALSASEIRQLDALDYPYFFYELGPDRSPPAWHWIDPDTGRRSRAPEFEGLPRVHAPFHTIVDRQNAERFAQAVVDAVRLASPMGPFDLHDRGLGVRVFRTPEDARTVVVILLGPERDRRLTCRIDADDALEMRID